MTFDTQELVRRTVTLGSVIRLVCVFGPQNKNALNLRQSVIIDYAVNPFGHHYRRLSRLYKVILIKKKQHFFFQQILSMLLMINRG